LDLVRWADVVVEAFSPRAMRMWGLDYESLRAVNPRIIMASSCLMGQTGPLASFAGFGNLAAAIVGFYEVTGWPDRAPVGPFAAYTDYLSPHFLLVAVLAALEHRRCTGEGQYLDFSQAEGSLHALAPALLDYTVNGRVATRRGNDDPAAAPHGVYPAQGEDRWLAVACLTDDHWRALAAAIGRADLLEDAGLARLEGRLARRAELDAAVAAWTATLEPTDAEARLQAAGIPAHQVQNSPECLADPQFAHLAHFREVEHPTRGEAVVEAPRIALGRTPGAVARGGPSLGQDIEDVLIGMLGYDGERLAELAVAEVFD
jgi:crotonobetainyl-CoA:carnitine CoA-transferase CaiB-like acyl-CoA transferase